MSKRGNQLLLGCILIRLGLISREQINAVLDAQSGSEQPLGKILVEQGLIDEEQLQRTLEIQRQTLAHEPFSNASGESTLFGQRAIRLKLATANQVNLALRELGRAWEEERVIKHLGEILVAHGVLDRAQVVTVLRSQGKRMGACQICGSRFNLPGPGSKKKVSICTVCGGALRPLEFDQIEGITITDDLARPEPERSLGLFKASAHTSSISVLENRDGSFQDPAVDLHRRQEDGDSTLAPQGAEDDAVAAEIRDLSASGRSDRYIVDREINRGGMGAILCAMDRDLRRPVAMKVMLTRNRGNDQYAHRFVEEAQLTGQLEHPNIVPIHELGVDANGNVYFTMKMVYGHSLDQVMEAEGAGREGSLDREKVARFLRIFQKICDAVGFAHSRGVIHRDLKPDNVMVGEFGEVQVMDWGLARILGRPDVHGSAAAADPADTEADGRNSHRTRDGQIMGTPCYMSPEQAQGKNAEVDRRSDIYSLGAILYEILCGFYPFSEYPDDATLYYVAEGKLRPPEKIAPKRYIPKELSAICMKAMAFSKEDRFQRVSELADDINAYLNGQMVEAYQYNPLQILGKWIWRYRMAAFANIAILIVILAAWGLLRYKESQRMEAEIERKAQERTLALDEADSTRTAARAALERARTANPETTPLVQLQTAYQESIDLYKSALDRLPEGELARQQAWRVELGEIYFGLFRMAEAQENAELTASYGGMVQHFLGDKYRPILQGDGRLSLTTNVSAEINLYPALEPPLLVADKLTRPGAYAGFDEERRRRLGKTPLKDVSVGMGSWLLVARAPGLRECRLPLWIQRGENLVISNLRLLPEKIIPEGMIYVPALRGRSGAPKSIHAIMDAPRFEFHQQAGFLISRREVTMEDWYQFLAYKEKKKKDEEDGEGFHLSDYLPHTMARGQRIQIMTMVDIKDRDWAEKKDLPVRGIPWAHAEEYAKWKGMRLPKAEEWETAARGADGRLYVWGNRFDPQKANVLRKDFSPHVRRVMFFHYDQSPFGVFDMNGNVAEWVDGWFDEALQIRPVCGGDFNSDQKEAILFVRHGEIATARSLTIGFRLAADLPEDP